jgi:hypothetical protein
MTRKLATAVLAVSVLWAVGSLAIKGGVGMSQAQLFSSHFNITSARAEIIHETAACARSNNSFVSCERPSFHSDSYEILAQLALYDVSGFQ